MTNAARRKRNAQRQADGMHERVGLTGWVIVHPGGTWYGPYASAGQAWERIGLRDSLDMKIEGTVVHAGPQD